MSYFTGTRKPQFTALSGIDYDRYWRERGFHINEKLKEREDIMLAAIPPGASVLDIGCGNSLLPSALRAKGCSVTVGDISPVVLDGFKALGIPTMVVDLEHIHEAAVSSIYDYIIMSEVLEHTKNPEEIIQTLKKHTAHFILTIPNSAFYRYRFHLMFHGRFFTQWVSHPSEHVRFWSHRDFVDWIGAMGLTLEQSVASNGFSFFGLLPGLKNWWKNLFGHQIVYFVTHP